MKNVLIIEPGLNCEYAIYAFTDDEFSTIFPSEGQNVEFIEDVERRIGDEAMNSLFESVWQRRVRKTETNGIHGTLFYQMEYKKRFYPTKNDEQMVDALD